MTPLRPHRTLSALLLALLLCAGDSSAAPRPLDRLVLNDGENLRLSLSSASDDVLIITHGRARRVPDAAKTAEDAPLSMNLDIVGRTISLRTNARQIRIAGAKTAEVTGIAASQWGDYETPAVFIDRDCRVTLKGRAEQSAVLEVHPLARATVDARRLDTREIVIVGNAGTNVLCAPGAKVSFLKREGAPATRTSGSSENWEPTPAAEPAAAPSPAAPEPPAAPPPAAPPSPGQAPAPVPQ